MDSFKIIPRNRLLSRKRRNCARKSAMGRIAEYFSLLFSCIPCRAASNKVVPFGAKTVDDASALNAAGSIHANDDDSGNPSSSSSLHRVTAAGNEPNGMELQDPRCIEQTAWQFHFCSLPAAAARCKYSDDDGLPTSSSFAGILTTAFGSESSSTVFAANGTTLFVLALHRMQVNNEELNSTHRRFKGRVSSLTREKTVSRYDLE